MQKLGSSANVGGEVTVPDIPETNNTQELLISIINMTDLRDTRNWGNLIEAGRLIVVENRHGKPAAIISKKNITTSKPDLTKALSDFRKKRSEYIRRASQGQSIRITRGNLDFAYVTPYSSEHFMPPASATKTPNDDENSLIAKMALIEKLTVSEVRRAIALLAAAQRIMNS